LTLRLIPLMFSLYEVIVYMGGLGICGKHWQF
jgi:hypothetical protein